MAIFPVRIRSTRSLDEIQDARASRDRSVRLNGAFGCDGMPGCPDFIQATAARGEHRARDRRTDPRPANPYSGRSLGIDKLPRQCKYSQHNVTMLGLVEFIDNKLMHKHCKNTIQ